MLFRSYKLPARLRLSDALPKTLANKTDKSALRNLDAQSRATS